MSELKGAEAKHTSAKGGQDVQPDWGDNYTRPSEPSNRPGGQQDTPGVKPAEPDVLEFVGNIYGKISDTVTKMAEPLMAYQLASVGLPQTASLSDLVEKRFSTSREDQFALFGLDSNAPDADAALDKAIKARMRTDVGGYSVDSDATYLANLEAFNRRAAVDPAGAKLRASMRVPQSFSDEQLQAEIDLRQSQEEGSGRQDKLKLHGLSSSLSAEQLRAFETFQTLTEIKAVFGMDVEVSDAAAADKWAALLKHTPEGSADMTEAQVDERRDLADIEVRRAHGLPEDASFGDVRDAADAKMRDMLGLPKDASLETYNQALLEYQQALSAARLGLSPQNHGAIEYREQALARTLPISKLPDITASSTAADVEAARDLVQSYARAQQMKDLGLGADATDEDIEAAAQARLRENYGLGSDASSAEVARTIRAYNDTVESSGEAAAQRRVDAFMPQTATDDQVQEVEQAYEQELTRALNGFGPDTPYEEVRLANDQSLKLLTGAENQGIDVYSDNPDVGPLLDRLQDSAIQDRNKRLQAYGLPDTANPAYSEVREAAQKLLRENLGLEETASERDVYTAIQQKLATHELAVEMKDLHPDSMMKQEGGVPNLKEQMWKQEMAELDKTALEYQERQSERAR